MGVGYTRQSVWATNDVVEASDGGDEFVLLESAMAAGTGHSHDGTSGEGGTLTSGALTTALTTPPIIGGTTPAAGDFTTLGTTGDITLTTANVVVSSGNGIDFSATADGSGTTTSELFDDCEKGSFTPVWVAAAGSGTVTYTRQVGFYVKLSDMVFCQIDIETLSISSRTGTVKISGLPFTQKTTPTPGAGSGSATQLNIAAGENIVAIGDSNATTLSLFTYDTTAGTTQLDAAEWSDNGRYRFVFSYTI